MKRVVLIGGGGYCSGVIDSLSTQNDYEIVGITDPKLPKGTNVCGVNVLGDDSLLPELYEQGVRYAFVTVGSVKTSEYRERIVKMAKAIGFLFISVIDSTAIIAKNVTMGEMVYVGKGAIINNNVRIGNFCIINTGAIVEHGCIIEDYVHIAPGAVLAGDIHIDSRAHIGLNASILQGVEIGPKAIVGAGAIVLRNIRDEEVAVGIVKNEKN